MKDHIKALDKAKIALMSRADSTFFTTVCFSLKHVWDEGIPTACTNGTEIRYNPQFFLQLDEQERVFLLIHESMHVALLHMLRLKDHKAEKWNIAADFVINGMLLERGFKMPKEGLHDPQYKGMSVEQVYALLPDATPGDFDMDLVEPGSDSVTEGLEESVKEILVRAATASKMAGDRPGTIPCDIEIYLDKLLKPKLPWKVILRRYLQTFAKNDFSFRTPNRRYFPKHLLPGMKSEKLMNLAIAVDTSGSVTDEEFQRFVSETRGILRMLDPDEITLVQFDTQVKSVDTLRSLRDLNEVTFQGRGGTRINPVIEWAQKAKPQLLLVFSDGEFYSPTEKPKCPVLWIIHNNKAFTAPFGQVLHYEV